MLYPLAAQDVDQEAVPAAEVHEGLPGGLSPFGSLFLPEDLKSTGKTRSVCGALCPGVIHTQGHVGLQCPPRRGGEASGAGAPHRRCPGEQREVGMAPRSPEVARAPNLLVSHPKPTRARSQLWVGVLQITVSSFRTSLSSSGFVYFERPYYFQD